MPRVTRINEVLGAFRETHPILLAEFHREDGPTAITLHTTQDADTRVGLAIFEGL